MKAVFVLAYILLQAISSTCSSDLIVEWTEPRYEIDALMVSCRTVIPAPSTPISLPPHRMQVYVGRKESEFFYTLSFDTNADDEDSCTASFEATARGRIDDRFDAAQTEDARKRYTGECTYDDEAINSPSRTITVKLSPVTDKDLFIWECSALWENRELSPGDLTMPILPRWNVRPENRYPEIQVVPRIRDEAMKIACVIPGFDHTLYRPPTNVTPHLDVSIVRKRDGVEIGYASRDVYGRLSSDTSYLSPWYYGMCTPEETKEPIMECLDVGSHSPLSWKSECSQVAYVISNTTINREETYVDSDSPIWITSSLLKNYFEAFETNSTAPFLTMNFDRPHVVLQLPSDSSVRPLRIHTASERLWIYEQDDEFRERVWKIDQYQVHVMPDMTIFRNFYANFASALFSRPQLEGRKLVPYVDDNGTVKANLSCGNDSAVVLFFVSGSCDVDGQMMSRQNCSEEGGEYRVAMREINDGELIVVTKRKLHNYENSIMNCIWRQYYCFSGTRTVELKTMTLLEPDPQEQGDRPWYGHDIANFGGKNVYKWEIIDKSECPIEDLRNPVVHRFAQVVDTDEIRQSIKNFLPKMPLMPTTKEALISHMNNTCVCRQKLNLCPVDLPGTVAYAVEDLKRANELQMRDTFTCNAMGRLSPERSYESLVTDYVCYDNISLADDATGRLVKYLPQIRTVLNKNLVKLSNNEEYARISCTNVKKKCVQNTLEKSLAPTIRFFSPVNGYLTLTQTTDAVMWTEYEYTGEKRVHNVTNTEPVTEHPVVLVNKPVTVFRKDDFSMEYLFKKSILAEYQNVTCTYLGAYFPGSSIIVENDLKSVCTNLSYTITAEVNTTATDLSAFSCAVNRSATCDMATLQLTVHPLNATIICPKTSDQEVTIGQEKRSFSTSGELLVEFDHTNARGRGYCVYDGYSSRAVLLLSSDNKPLQMTCDVKTPQSISYVIHVPTSEKTSSCVVPPALFRPVAEAINDSVVTCRLPRWVHDSTCTGNQIRTGDVTMYFTDDDRSIATLGVDGSCAAAPGYSCRSNNDDDGNRLLSVKISDDARGKFMTCAMNGMPVTNDTPDRGILLPTKPSTLTASITTTTATTTTGTTAGRLTDYSEKILWLGIPAVMFTGILTGGVLLMTRGF